ncbi:hypothetical protein [uncultured Psychroserpens sp.]|uniref:hypothetical protein n=1 Tax=uncultured Psychroserpens sp. TaxID=255436 RepID=UPI00261B4466|nr:hypothetical protein [uncultured Psychroserpens sp.]
MAPIKFEENIKDKLEKRSIRPSSDAWNQLSEQLDAQNKKSSRSLFLYIGIAASFVGVLLVTTLFFKSSEKQIVSPNVVETEVNEQIKSEDANRPFELATEENVAVDSATKNESLNTNAVNTEKSLTTSIEKERIKMAQISEEKKAPIVEEKSIIENLNTQDTRVALNKPNKGIEDIEKASIAVNTLTQEELKVLKVVNQIKALDADGTAATDEEIEDLLKRAEKDILKQRIYNETTRTVDADALLQDVEDDLDQSFRSKVFEALKSSYNTVKTAVAERNN